MPKNIEKLIAQSLAENIELEQVLKNNDLTYDDLRYSSDSDFQSSTVKYRDLSAFRKASHGIPVVSFFSGCGGLDLGFEAAGYQHLTLVEHNEIFCNTLRHNRDWNVIGPPGLNGDVSEKDALFAQLQELGVTKNFNGVFVGGPPCQPFSIASNQRFSKNGKDFKRTGFDHEENGNLLFDYIWFIQKFRPKVFLIENVTGLVDLDDGKQVGRAYELLRSCGYQINPPFKVNAAQYGVPQQRERIFIIGFLGKNTFIPPKQAKTIVPCISALENLAEECPNHITRKHKTNSMMRYIKLGIGKRDKLGRVDRLNPNLPSKTVIAGGNSGGGRSHLHPYIPRTLSVRESARLQTFPDNYIFTGSSARQFTQVGNAVPPVLAAQLATAIYESYFKIVKKSDKKTLSQPENSEVLA